MLDLVSRQYFLFEQQNRASESILKELTEIFEKISGERNASKLMMAADVYQPFEARHCNLPYNSFIIEGYYSPASVLFHAKIGIMPRVVKNLTFQMLYVWVLRHYLLGPLLSCRQDLFLVEAALYTLMRLAASPHRKALVDASKPHMILSRPLAKWCQTS